jgi:hypothetical protein
VTVTALALLVAAAILVTVGAALVYVPAGIIVAGLCAGLVGWNLLPESGNRR